MVLTAVVITYPEAKMSMWEQICVLWRFASPTRKFALYCQTRGLFFFMEKLLLQKIFLTPPDKFLTPPIVLNAWLYYILSLCILIICLHDCLTVHWEVTANRDRGLQCLGLVLLTSTMLKISTINSWSNMTRNQTNIHHIKIGVFFVVLGLLFK